MTLPPLQPPSDFEINDTALRFIWYQKMCTNYHHANQFVEVDQFLGARRESFSAADIVKLNKKYEEIMLSKTKPSRINK